MKKFIKLSTKKFSAVEDEMDDEFEPTLVPFNIFINKDNNQPIIMDGKYLAASNLNDLPELRGKVKNLTGITNITVEKTPVPLTRVKFISTDSQMEKNELSDEAFKSNIELNPDVLYGIYFDKQPFMIKGVFVLFASESDAYHYGDMILEYYNNQGQEKSFIVVPFNVSLAGDSKNPMLADYLKSRKFIFVSNSAFQFNELPETQNDLLNNLSYFSIGNITDIDTYLDEQSGKYDERYAALNILHKTALRLEKMDKIQEAEELHKFFMKIAKKKKSKKKKNVPNDPSLWASCQAWAKATYDIHPSAYSNAGAARRYRQKGGTWRKE
jgi:hypothetical protein